MAKKRSEPLVIASKAKAAIKKHKLNVSSDALEGLNQIVQWYIDTAARRTKANGRKTVRAHDFIA